MVIRQLKDTYQKLPANIRLFLKRAFILLVAWNLLYLLVLEPLRVPDKQLTNITAFVTAEFLRLFYDNVTLTYSDIRATLHMPGMRLIGISDACNALELMVLYVGFLFCFPTSRKRFWTFTLIGLVVIFMLNILRCAGIVWLNVAHRGWVDIGHHYIFKVTLYSLIFYAWVQYCKRYIQPAA